MAKRTSSVPSFAGAQGIRNRNIKQHPDAVAGAREGFVKSERDSVITSNYTNRGVYGSSARA